MNHEIITHTPITMDNGKVVEAYIHKLPSGMYAMHADYPFQPNSNSTRTRQIVDALFRSQHRDWFRFIRFQRWFSNRPARTYLRSVSSRFWNHGKLADKIAQPRSSMPTWSCRLWASILSRFNYPKLANTSRWNSRVNAGSRHISLVLKTHR